MFVIRDRTGKPAPLISVPSNGSYRPVNRGHSHLRRYQVLHFPPFCATYSRTFASTSGLSPLPVIALRYDSPHEFGIQLLRVYRSNGKLFFHVRDALKAKRVHKSDYTGRKHLDLFTKYVRDNCTHTADRLSVLLAKQEITYDMLWAFFEPNAEVYTHCPGTNAQRCVLYNYCEERQEKDKSKYMHFECRYLNSNGTDLGEAIAPIKIPFFRGAKQIQHLPAYPLKYHAEEDKVRQELIQCGQQFVSLNGPHHRRYNGKAYYVDEKGIVVGSYVDNRIMVDAISFQKHNPDYPCPRVHTAQKKQPWGHIDEVGTQIKLEGIDKDNLDERDYLICSPTVYGFGLRSKLFCTHHPQKGAMVTYQLQWSLPLPTSAKSNGVRARLTMFRSLRRRRI